MTTKTVGAKKNGAYKLLRFFCVPLTKKELNLGLGKGIERGDCLEGEWNGAATHSRPLQPLFGQLPRFHANCSHYSAKRPHIHATSSHYSANRSHIHATSSHYLGQAASQTPPAATIRPTGHTFTPAANLFRPTQLILRRY